MPHNNYEEYNEWVMFFFKYIYTCVKQVCSRATGNDLLVFAIRTVY